MEGALGLPSTIGKVATVASALLLLTNGLVSRTEFSEARKMT